MVDFAIPGVVNRSVPPPSKPLRSLPSQAVRPALSQTDGWGWFFQLRFRWSTRITMLQPLQFWSFSNPALSDKCRWLRIRLQSRSAYEPGIDDDSPANSISMTRTSNGEILVFCFIAFLIFYPWRRSHLGRLKETYWNPPRWMQVHADLMAGASTTLADEGSHLVITPCFFQLRT